jgi:hypothetical protein
MGSATLFWTTEFPIYPALRPRGSSSVATRNVPINRLRRAPVMLIAYYDDSGTHDGSAAVVYGGFIGHEDTWASFEPKWRAILQRERLKRFHLADCEAGEGEFRNWLGRTSGNFSRTALS